MQCTRIHSSEQTVQNNVQGERNGMSKHFMNIQARRSFVWSRHRASIGLDQSSRIEHNWPPRAFAVLSIVEVFGWHCCSTAVTGACTWHDIVNNTRHVSIPAPINKRVDPITRELWDPLKIQFQCQCVPKSRMIKLSVVRDWSSRLFDGRECKNRPSFSLFLILEVKFICQLLWQEE